MLSNQQHYDWGLRAIKTVLKTCANLMFEERHKIISSSNKNQEITHQQEYEIVLNSIQLNTMSKLTFADSQRFRNLLNDIFLETKKMINHV